MSLVDWPDIPGWARTAHSRAVRSHLRVGGSSYAGPVKPGERIKLIKESAASLAARPWLEIQLVLREHGLRTWEPSGYDDDPEPLAYCMGQLSDAGDDTLADLHAYVVGEDSAPGRQQATDRPWGSNPVAVFLSHRHEDAPFASKVRDLLTKYYGIDAFVAHNDITPSAAWRAEIQAALSSCHFMVAVLHDKFHESQWCDQEVGWAMGRGVPVMPVRRQPHPGSPRYDGFMEALQDCVIGPQYGDDGTWWLAEQIFVAVLSDPKTRAIGVKALAEALVNSYNWNHTRNVVWPLIEKVERWEPEQLRRLEYAVETNREVYDCVIGEHMVPDLVKALVATHEPPTPVPPPPNNDPWSSPTPNPFSLPAGKDEPPF